MVWGLRYYEYEVYCDRSVLVGKVLQTAMMKDMNSDSPELLRAGGLCSFFTVNIHPDMVVEYREHSMPVKMVQNITMGGLVNHSSSNKIRLVGKMNVFVCLPCCCFILKLLFPEMIPWNQYDIFDPNHDFSSGTAPLPKSMERGGPSPSAAPMEQNSKSAMESHPHYETSSQVSSPSFKADYVASTYSTSSETSSREGDIKALEQLKDSGVLSHAEYNTKVNQVNAKYNGSSPVQSELDALTKLYQDRIITSQEYDTKRDIVMKMDHY